jgi:hypothetical protein
MTFNANLRQQLKKALGPLALSGNFDDALDELGKLNFMIAREESQLDVIHKHVAVLRRQYIRRLAACGLDEVAGYTELVENERQ